MYLVAGVHSSAGKMDIPIYFPLDRLFRSLSYISNMKKFNLHDDTGTASYTASFIVSIPEIIFATLFAAVSQKSRPE